MGTPLFIKFGNVRIKFKNIKDYGIANVKERFILIDFDIYGFSTKKAENLFGLFCGKENIKIVETCKMNISEDFAKALKDMF